MTTEFSMDEIKKLLKWRKQKIGRSVDIEFRDESSIDRAWCYDINLHCGEHIYSDEFRLPDIEKKYEKEQKEEYAKLKLKFEGKL